MSQALYRKYRPKSWDQVVGQDHVVQTLKNAIAADRVGHAYLFAGPRGTGKTSVARIFAKAVNCLEQDSTLRPCNQCENCTDVNNNRFMDLIEMDAASNTGVDDVRDLRDKVGFAPAQGRFRVYIIDEVHMLSTQAFNALLKTLEEPPPHAIFVLATTEIHKIPATVLSRCQRHEFRRITVQEILDNLRGIVESEALQADGEALTLVARQATGSIRDAQSLLDQLSSAGERISLDLAQSVLGTAPSQALLEIVESIDEGRPAAALDALRRALDSGADPRTLSRQVVEYLRALLMIKLGNISEVEATEGVRQRMASQAAHFSSSELLQMLKSFNAAATDTRGGWQPSLSLELALAGTLEARSASPASTASGPNGSHGQVSGSSGRTEPRSYDNAQPQDGQRSGSRAGVNGEPHDAPMIRENEAGQRAGPSGAAGGSRTAPSVVGLSEVANAWKEIRLALRHGHPAVGALLNSSKPVDVKGDVLFIGFQSETVRSLMDKPDNIKAARLAIAQVLGSELKINCVVTNARGKVPPHLSQDGMVATAVDRGGEIVDVQEHAANRGNESP
jgi:DNA polymerase III subunit gamma/tau